MGARHDHHSDIREVMFIQAKFTWAIRNSPSYGMLHQALRFLQPSGLVRVYAVQAVGEPGVTVEGHRVV